jgi:hypothetical protein
MEEIKMLFVVLLVLSLISMWLFKVDIVQGFGIVCIVGVLLLAIFLVLSLIFSIVRGVRYVLASPDKKAEMKSKSTEIRRKSQAQWEADAPKREANRIKAEKRKVKWDALVAEGQKPKRKRRGKSLGYIFASSLLKGMAKGSTIRKGTASRRGVYRDSIRDMK